MYLWIKAFHVIFMVTWFAGLFYLPRLFVYHAMCEDAAGLARFKIMERKLYRGIMAPAALLTVGFGTWLIALNGAAWFAACSWLHIKLALVALLVVYHLYLGWLRRRFAEDRNCHGHVFYRWLNEAPVLILVAVVLLAEIKPSF
ncbi:MAG: protoporphyrinogen oxidase HemJ [Gammaproteobacteria bacterium]|nr:protoporphyrinogen oxidase HemJ [Gammaproteobacteria bacterium]